MHSAGPQFVVPFGDKLVDFNQHFKLFLSTHNPTPNLPPDTTAIVSEVSFTSTREGFTAQVGYMDTLVVIITVVPSVPTN